MPAVFAREQVDVGYSLQLNKAQQLNREGSLLLEQGEAQAALNAWQEAVSLYEKAGNINGVLGSQINQTFALQSLGRYREALQILKNIDEKIKTASDPLLKATAKLSWGNTLQQIGDLDNAWCMLKDGLKLVETNQSSSVSQNLKTQIQLSLGNTARFFAKRIKSEQGAVTSEQSKAFIQTCEKDNKLITGNYQDFDQQAKNYYEQVLDLENSPNQRLTLHLNFISFLVEAGTLKDAENYVGKYWPELEREIEKISPTPAGIMARINLARSLTLLEKPTWDTKAEALLNRAISESKALKNERLLSQTTGNLGWFYKERNNIEKATENTKEAVRIAQAIGAEDIAYQWQWQLGRIYNKKDIKSAIKAYEAAVDTLQKVRQNLVGIDAGFEGVTSNFQANFTEEVDPVYRELVGLLLDPVAGGNSPENIKEALGVIELLQLAELENFLLCDLSQVQKIQPARSIEEAKQKVDEKLAEVFKADPTAAIIYPIILEDRLEVIRVLPDDNLRHVATVKAKKEVEETIDELRIALQGNNTAQFKGLSSQVDQWVISPFQQELENKTLLFVLDLPLLNIPMAALYNKETEKYLIEENPVALISSLQLLDLNPSETGIPKALTAGLTKGRPERGIEFGNLSYVTEELDEINKVLLDSVKFIDKNFTESSIQDQLNFGFFPIIHLATHGHFSSKRNLTFLLDGVAIIDIEDLRKMLESRDKIQAESIELLVMSACETAKGDRQAALGLAGVAIRAGARTTIASLWSVDDLSTSILMREFYNNKYPLSSNNSIVSKMTKAEALRQAQISLIHKPENINYRFPRFWAPFVLIGNWR
ncbi:CHAT domain-containing protein [Ancylothrix sp. D3o]|uniref:CHAT domain-containing protein n=1 Tax=Ancylothrix sp. D3o TaxID=2953691 RepID=UPI0021BB6F00|nr:CHAT domain-containing protein [Ancylothrix sp. D3o]